MLRQRVVTGVILAVAFLGAVFFLHLEALAAILGAVSVAGAWEWSGLSGIKAAFARAAYTVFYVGLLAATWLVLGIGRGPRF
jgi:phosphatidate cytidylyltransferase